MLITALIGCKKGEYNTDDDYVPPENDPYEKDDLPELDFDDEDVTILYWSEDEHDEFDIMEPSDDMLKMRYIIETLPLKKDLV